MSAHSRMGVRPPPLHAENKLLNAARPTVTLLVEGHIDLRFWRTYSDARYCKVRRCHGRPNALAELDRAASDVETRLLAVLDADFDRLEGKLVERDDVVWTDAHDLETTLLLSPVLEKLLRAMVDEAGDEASFRSRLWGHGVAMGRLRWLAQRARLPLVFKKGTGGDLKPFDKYPRCVGEDWSPDLSKTVAEIINYSCQPALKSRDLVDECAALPDSDPDQVCNGHDLLGFLKVGLEHRARGSERKTIKKINDLDDRLVDAYERAWFEETSMWRDVRAWEGGNPPFRVLRRDRTMPSG